jgi:tetratricopeptide (TPR) repeat protein
LSRGQIQNCLPGNEISDFAATSSKDDWGKRAKNFFSLKQYDQAKDSYMRADNLRMAAVANAYVLQDIAQKMPDHLGTTKTRPAAFESAAQAFLVCARDAHESGSSKYKDYHQLAAKCLEEAGNIIKAAENYRIAENFTKAALLFRRSGKFDDAYDIITNHSDKVAPEDLESVKDVTRLYYLKEKKFQ